jgi:hypothetical protein
MSLEFKKNREKLLRTPTADLDLSIRAYNCVRAAKIETLGDLINHTPEQLGEHRNFGAKSISEIETIVEELGLKLKHKDDFMKLELIKEEKLNDTEPAYFINLDGKYLDGTWTRDLDKVNNYYKKLVENPNIMINSQIVLMSQEIDVSLANTKTQL